MWYLSEGKKENVSPKLQIPYIGPCVVLQKLGDVDYCIQINKAGKRKVVHANKLKSYMGKTPPTWVNKATKSITPI